MSRSFNTSKQRDPILSAIRHSLAPKMAIASSLLITFLTNAAILPANAIVPQNSLVAQIPETTETSPIVNQLLGIWQYQDPESEELLRFLFADNQQFYVIATDSEGNSEAIEGSYQINSDSQPMQIDFQINSEEKALTVFELTPEGKLRLQIDGINPGNPRPENLSENATLLEKVSDEPTLPEDVEIIDLETDQKQSRQIPRQDISLLAKAQPANFLKKGIFATNSKTQFERDKIIKPENLTSQNRELLSETTSLLISQVEAENSAVDDTNETTETSPIVNQLLGIWQYQDPESEALLRLVFTENEQLYTILPTEDGSYVAVEMSYEINSDSQPMQIDLQINSQEKALTVFELTSEGKLRLELDGIAAGNSRPENLSENATLFEKVSDDPTLPEDIQTVELESSEEQARRVPIQYISLLAQAQQAYFLEKGTFAANLAELGIVANLETASYRYEIVKPESEQESVTITAHSKDSELPSYTAALFVTEVDGEKTTVGGICETNEPSTSPPATPTILGDDSQEIKCPVGASLLE